MKEQQRIGVLSCGKRIYKEYLNHTSIRQQKTHIAIVNTSLSTQINEHPSPDASNLTWQFQFLPSSQLFVLCASLLCRASIIDINLVCFNAGPRPPRTPGNMSRVHNVSNTDPRRAPDLVPRPTFGLWDAIFFLNQDATSLIDADEVVFGHWDDYADQAINVLHQMINQTEMLVFSQDEYTDLVRTFQAFPPPSQSLDCAQRQPVRRARVPFRRPGLSNSDSRSEGLARVGHQA